jgi:hypothetical protein
MLLTATATNPPRLWDVRTGRLLLEPGSFSGGRWPEGRSWDPAFFTPDGGRVVVGHEATTLVFDGRPLQ